MFDRISRRYDLMNRLLSLGLDGRWRRRAVAELVGRDGARDESGAMLPSSEACPAKTCFRRRKHGTHPMAGDGPRHRRPGGRYLDVGCGTGDVGIEIVRQCAGASVVGIDPAERMLDVGREKLRRAGLADAVALECGDALALPFGDATFDGAIAAFCIRNVTDRVAALAEMRRVLVPGGRAVVLELTVPPGRLMRAGHRFYTAWLVPLAGRLIARNRDAYRYLVASVRQFPRAEEFLATLSRAGLVNLRHVPLFGGTVTVFVGQAP